MKAYIRHSNNGYKQTLKRCNFVMHTRGKMLAYFDFHTVFSYMTTSNHATVHCRKNLPGSEAKCITANALKHAILKQEELAILDVREKGVFSRGHILLAASAPLWRIELLIDRLVPRRATPIVVVDDNGNLSARAAEKLNALGYTDVSILDGGIKAWERQGNLVYSGTNVVGKAFGEVLEATYHTPHITVPALLKKLELRDNLVVVDGRTPEEFARFSLPFAHNIPNGELVYRIAQIAPDPETLIVINCAGRTRSIVGAQTLISAGIKNPVVALEDGTMAWLREGHALRHGALSDLHDPGAKDLDIARERAARFAQQAGVKRIDALQFAAFQAESADRSLYTLDVRTAGEYAAGHLPGWRWAPGGQLIQGPDQYIGTLRSRVVIADWDGVRALTSAAWLAQIAQYEVYVFSPETPETVALGAEVTQVRLGRRPRAALVQPADVARLNAHIYDVESSLAFQEKHIAGASFAAPDRLPEFLRDLVPDALILITSSDGVLARIVADELVDKHRRRAYALAGGNRAWYAFGGETASGRDAILTGDDDDWHSPYNQETEVERLEKMREYLQWETALADKVKHDDLITFNLIEA